MSTHSRDKSLLGASWKVAGFACYAGLNAIARYLSGGVDAALDKHLSVYEIVFFQDLFALLLLLPWMIRRGKMALVPNHFILHLLRVLTSAIAIISWYFALVFMPLAQAVALSIVGPMIGVIGAKWFLKEKFGWIRGSIIVLSLIGACILLHPGSVLLENKSNLKGLLFIGSAAFFFAMAKLVTRRLAQLGETAQTLTSYLFIFIVPVSFIPAMMHWVTPDWSHWPWLILAGGLTALAIYCVSSALVYAEVSFLAPFDICQFILNTIVGYVAFTELPAPWAIWIVLAFIGFSLSARKKWI
ncbi:MAG: DMT family transporter [Gammaproteobacteria bacterium]|nr:DMT family transporter [Gammaproteobacteria bacterium]